MPDSESQSLVLESFVGKEEELNEQMRLRYKADLNGEYPDPESEAASDVGMSSQAILRPVYLVNDLLIFSTDSKQDAKENTKFDSNVLSSGSSGPQTPLKPG